MVKPKTKGRYIEFMQEMLHHADLYIQIVTPSLQFFGNRQEYQCLVQSFRDLTDDLNIVQVRIPLLALLDAKNRRVLSSAMLKETVKYLEGFHFAFSVLTAGRPNKIDSAFSSFSIRLHRSSSKEESREIIQALHSKLDPLFPEYKKFRDAFVKLAFTKDSVPSNVLTRYALRRLNCYYSNEDVLPSGLTVEHIAPESEGTAYCNIGNLILLETRLNGEADDQLTQRNA